MMTVLMKPYVKLAEARLPDGTLFSLHKHDGNFYLKNGRLDLMSTALTFSEQMLAEKGCAALLADAPTRPEHPHILIGGLGMGFTLKRTLELVASPATIEVAELVPEIIEWNRTFLVEHNGPLLDDPRTEIYQGDLFDCLAKRGQTLYDAILIDIDDAPDMLITKGNERLYTPKFFQTLRKALALEGQLAFWLAEATPSFEKSLEQAGFHVESFPAKPHAQSKRARHSIVVGHKRE